jgi:hypothetical protein
MIFFVSLSRIYLGRHFLADILGGLLVGFILAFVFYKLVFQNVRLTTFFFKEQLKFRFNLKFVLLIIYFSIIPFLVLFVSFIEPRDVASFLGLNLGFILVWFRGIPKNTGNVLQRVARVLIAGIVFIVLRVGLEKCAGFFFTDEPLVVEFIRYTLLLFLFFWGSTEIGIKLGLFKR